MTAACLFFVLVLAKFLAIFGKPIPWSYEAIFAFTWQDALLASLLGLVELVAPKRVTYWFYGILVAYTAINVPVIRVLSTPLTFSLWKATGGALADSIRLYLTFMNVASVLLVITAGIALPKFFANRFTFRRWVVASLGAWALLGMTELKSIDSYGLHRNAVVTLVTTSVPRVRTAVETGDWRTSPNAGSAPLEDLTRFRRTAAGRNVVVVILESTAALYLKPYGAALDPMPNLTKLSERGITFESAYSVYPESIKGLFSSICAVFPAFDTEPENYERIHPKCLPKALSDEGYQTAMFHSGRFRYLGMDSIVRNRGFHVLEDAGHLSGNPRSSFGIDDERVTIKRVLGWIDSLPKGQRFFTAYLPVAGHHPYYSPDKGPFPNKEEVDFYRNSIHHADVAVGLLVEGLRERGLLDNTLLVFFGDHGEAFGQHPGNYAHTLQIYDENVHVPLVIVPPGGLSKPLRVKRPASLIDVSPTILDFAGIAIPEEYQGLSLLDPSRRVSLFFTDYSLGLLGIRDENWKVIHQLDGNRTNLYDMKNDPGETNNLAVANQDIVDKYVSHLMRWSASQRHRITHPALSE